MADSTTTTAAATRRDRPEWLQKPMEYIDRAKQFLHETRVEMRGVTWPSRSEMVSTTVVVILTTAFFAVFLWLVDLAAQHIIGVILKALRQ